MSDGFDDVVEGLDSAEQERLRHVHELLIEAGPPPELSLRLAKLPAHLTETKPSRFPRRRFAGAIALAGAALAAAAFGGGYVAGGHHGSPKTVRVATMIGSNALASLRVGAPDSGGNWPIDFTVTGLTKDPGQYSYYEVFAIRNGKPVYPCGGFRVVNGSTLSKRFWVPYAITTSTKWIVTEVNEDHAWPGRTVMTMA